MFVMIFADSSKVCNTIFHQQRHKDFEIFITGYFCCY